MFKGIKTKYFSAPQKSQLTEFVLDIIGNCKYDNDILLLCDRSCPEMSVPEEYSGFFKVHLIDDILSFFMGKEILQEHKNAGAFITVPGWLEKWQHNLIELDYHGNMDRFRDTYTYILILDTGIHSDPVVWAEEFSTFTGVPFEMLDVGMAHFNLVLENTILRWDVGKKKDQLKQCNRKAASYAMSIDFIRTIADLTDESEAVDSICNLFSTMFAPEKVLYHAFNGDGELAGYCETSGLGRECIMQLKDSDSSYVVFDSEDGFAIKISTAEDILGIVEVHCVAFPEYLNEYLSVAHDLAKASGLAISNIRRYYELFQAREEEAKLAEMLRTTNRILRHDIANDLQVIIGALDLFEETDNKEFISMIRKAAQKGVFLIRNMREHDRFVFDKNCFELLNVKNLVDAVISKHTAEFSVKGNCLVMADKAMSSVFDNIISNAIIHGKAGKVEIEIIRQDDKCRVSFADNGIGIPDRVKPKVFDEGFKYGETGHTGFGLFIARKVVEQCNGSIHVEDNIPSGTVFVIELPSVDIAEGVVK
ncbi:ATP-binding protein [Methanolobus sp. WCC5]|uniref:sensor histidine kinase n=1 Tax=Methanolobus sp. WCC5 TaxID=3125785 RepID=UPI0032563D2C